MTEERKRELIGRRLRTGWTWHGVRELPPAEIEYLERADAYLEATDCTCADVEEDATCWYYLTLEQREAWVLRALADD